MDDSIEQHSPYRRFTVEQWAELRHKTPLPLTEDELEQLRGINVKVSIDEVAQVYLPLSRLLSLYVESVMALNRGTRQFMGVESGKVPLFCKHCSNAGPSIPRLTSSPPTAFCTRQPSWSVAI